MTKDWDNPRPHPPNQPNGIDAPPAIRELFRLLPPPAEEFPNYDRVAFLEACAALFDVIYDKAPAPIKVYVNNDNLRMR